MSLSGSVKRAEPGPLEKEADSGLAAGHLVQAVEAGSHLIGEAFHCFRIHRLIVIFGHGEHVTGPLCGVRGAVGAELGELRFGKLLLTALTRAI